MRSKNTILLSIQTLLFRDFTMHDPGSNRRSFFFYLGPGLDRRFFQPDE
jgi:hypothetical protein